MRTRSTFRILPRNGSTAWNSRLRPCLALPPALSPSTMNTSDLAGSRSWQSASLPGNDATPSALLRVISRALRAASRAAAAWMTLPTVVSGKRDLFLFRYTTLLRVAGHLASQGAAEASQMGAAVPLRDIIGE